MHHNKPKRSACVLFLPLLLTALFLANPFVTPASANDDIFPPSARAKAAIDFDGHGFFVKGKRTFIASAGLEYARIPRALWRDRLLRIKRAGFNTVEIYVFWNFHEPQEGKWNFSGDHDLGAFLKQVHELGLWAIVRVGPYVCAEWDSGGFPVWLRFKPNLRVREPNPAFEAVVDRYFEKVIPIVTAQQIHRGGAVILVQLENEHPRGWGTEMPNPYFHHLREKALALGLEVPYFFSGLHHSNDPAGNRPWDSVARKSPWFSTEFWCNWYDKYGNPNPQETRHEDRATWKILAYGGNGYNYYMFHGGTNFDHFNSNEDASSYDYGSAIGQAGDLRAIYYKFKRAAQFATSFAPILADSTNATAKYARAATSETVRVTARTSPSGDAVFLDNNGASPVETQVRFENGERLPSEGPLRLEAGEIMPIVRDFPLGNALSLKRAATRILGITPQGEAMTTLVVYGQVGTPFELRFGLPVGIPADFRAGKSGLKQEASGDVSLRGRFTQSAADYRFAVGARQVHVLAVSDILADKTFFVEANNQNYVICGTSYVGDVEGKDNRLRVMQETPWGKAFDDATVYGPDGVSHVLPVPPSDASRMVSAPALGAWEIQSASEGISSFSRGNVPLPMGADGDDSAYAWYHARFSVPQTGDYTLALPHLRDRGKIFVDGVLTPSNSLNLSRGDHALDILAISYGRDKIFGHLGPINTVDIKGLVGPVSLRQTEPGGTSTVTEWKYQRTEAPQNTPPSPGDANWQPVTIGTDVFARKRGWAWYQAVLPQSHQGTRVLHFEGVDDNAILYLNGVKIGEHKGWDSAFDVNLNTPIAGKQARLTPADVLTLLVENTDNTGGIAKPVTLNAYSYDAPITTWQMHGGIAEPSTDGWKVLGPAPSAVLTESPKWFRTTFTAPPKGAAYPILRATFGGLSRGFMYLNGHNLGRYPERIPINGIYLPECWLNEGKNTLMILDEDGNTPSSVRLEIEESASRVVQEQTLEERRPSLKERAQRGGYALGKDGRNGLVENVQIPPVLPANHKPVAHKLNR